jgi:hypothetical protein
MKPILSWRAFVIAARISLDWHRTRPFDYELDA